MDQTPRPDLVSVFKTGDPALVPLATMALESEHIEYSVRTAGKADSWKWMMAGAIRFPQVLEIFVMNDVAERARDILSGLAAQDASALPTFDAGAAALSEASVPPGIELEHAGTGEAIGAITESQWQELTSHLAEQGPNEYFIDDDAIHALEEANADPGLIALLQKTIGDGSARVRWRVSNLA